MIQARASGSVALVLALFFIPDAVPAASVAQRVERRAASRPAETDFEAASKAEADAVAQVLAVRARRASLEANARELDAQAVALGDRARERASDLARVDAARKQVESRLVRTELRLEAAKVLARRAAAEMYRGAGSNAPPILGFIGGSGSVREVSVRQHYAERAGELVMGDLNAVKVARRQVIDARRVLEVQEREVRRAAVAAQTEQAQVIALRQDQERALEAVRVQEARENQVLAAAQARRAEFERAAAAGRAASGTIEDILAARPVSGTAPDQLRFPADGPITSRFGQRVHPIFNTTRMHSGIDIGASSGAPVIAGIGGIVVVSGPASGYGTTVVIDHGGGVATLYGHLSRINVRSGQTVSSGQTVGAVGSSGNSTGPHLHFEVRVRGVPVDPMRYL